MQEILDQIADIDLVLNLKCKEESVVKTTFENGTYSPPQELHSMTTSGLNLSLEAQTGHFQSSGSTELDAIWKEKKLRMYTEQVPPISHVAILGAVETRKNLHLLLVMNIYDKSMFSYYNFVLMFLTI